jgi:hypothetical protein
MLEVTIWTKKRYEHFAKVKDVDYNNLGGVVLSLEDCFVYFPQGSYYKMSVKEIKDESDS